MQCFFLVVPHQLQFSSVCPLSFLAEWLRSSLARIMNELRKVINSFQISKKFEKIRFPSVANNQKVSKRIKDISKKVEVEALIDTFLH